MSAMSRFISRGHWRDTAGALPLALAPEGWTWTSHLPGMCRASVSSEAQSVVSDHSGTPSFPVTVSGLGRPLEVALHRHGYGPLC